MANVPRPSPIRTAGEEPPLPLPERVSVALAELSESTRQRLLAFCVGIDLSWCTRSSRRGHATGGPARQG
jgi:hypothetical protein